jgi:hypothetical protein
VCVCVCVGGGGGGGGGGGVGAVVGMSYKFCNRTFSRFSSYL